MLEDHFGNPPLGLRNSDILPEPTKVKEKPEPHIDLAVVEHFEGAYGPGQPNIDATIAQVQREAGKRDIVIELRAMYNRQQEAIYTQEE